MALGAQDSRDFTQHLVRVCAELEGMRHQHQVCNAGLDRQRANIRLQARRPFGRNDGAKLHAVGAQKVILGQSDLECVETENVGDLVIEMPLLGLEQFAAQRAGKPRGKVVAPRMR